uniref:Neugrin n=1 Tax=Timspurckia oligopyrenoides TaxID=708627 RepID=A0A7S1EQZ7_9RHOD|mmetsp:Transcript_13576/g.24338  ORF Transcript_13576/g.24338 Transcript_13576/m.24338 type:complete len:389 (+) Transcript_13576:64-1230(+)
MRLVRSSGFLGNLSVWFWSELRRGTCSGMRSGGIRGNLVCSGLCTESTSSGGDEESGAEGRVNKDEESGIKKDLDKKTLEVFQGTGKYVKDEQFMQLLERDRERVKKRVLDEKEKLVAKKDPVGSKSSTGRVHAFVSQKDRDLIVELNAFDPQTWTSSALASKFSYPLNNVRAILKLAKIRNDLKKVLGGTLPEELITAKEVWQTLPEPISEKVSESALNSNAISLASRGSNFEVFTKAEKASEALSRRNLANYVVSTAREEEEEAQAEVDGSQNGDLTTMPALSKRERRKLAEDHEWMQQAEMAELERERELEKLSYYRNVTQHSPATWKRSRWLIVDTSKDVINSERMVRVRESDGTLRVGTPRERKQALQVRGVVFPRRTRLDCY